MPDSTRPSPVPAVLLWAGLALCMAGLVVHRMWEDLPFPRAVEHGLLALLALAAAWPKARLADRAGNAQRWSLPMDPPR